MDHISRHVKKHVKCHRNSVRNSSKRFSFVAAQFSFWVNVIVIDVGGWENITTEFVMENKNNYDILFKRSNFGDLLWRLSSIFELKLTQSKALIFEVLA